MKEKTSDHTHLVRQLATVHGFMGAGIAKAEFMDPEAKRLEGWIKKGYHGEMGYMANHFDLRTDPTKLVPGAKSVVSLMYNYFPDEEVKKELDENEEKPALKISRYAYGEDYHKVVRRKLKLLVHELREKIGDFHARVFVDSAPVLERDWARRSGTGWIGKNTMLINPRKGSYFFLAEIILDVELDYDHPIKDHCGTCTRCIDACPTDAISSEGYLLDGSKCISYLTIELKNEIPEIFHGKTDGWIFGCDICQEVCPWNRFSEKHAEPSFNISMDLNELTYENWIEITEEIFEQKFQKSPLRRAGFKGLSRNINFTQRNS